MIGETGERKSAVATPDGKSRKKKKNEGLPGVAAIVDDILVYGNNQENHDAKREAVLRRTRERGIKLNPEKCVCPNQSGDILWSYMVSRWLTT